jgi:hypothetical protein
MSLHPKFIFSLFTLTALLLTSVVSRADSDAASLISNSGFEDGDSGFYLNVAGDSKDAKCRFSIDKTAFHSGAQALLLQSDDFARYGVGVKIPIHPLAGGDRYRVGVWIKAGADFQAQPGSPGVVLRLDPASGFPATPANSLIFLNLDGTVATGIFPPKDMKPVLKDWTHLDAVIEVPQGMDSMGATLFVWKAKGSLNVDDFTFEKVDSSTALTTVVPGPSSP